MVKWTNHPEMEMAQIKCFQLQLPSQMLNNSKTFWNSAHKKGGELLQRIETLSAKAKQHLLERMQDLEGRQLALK